MIKDQIYKPWDQEEKDKLYFPTSYPVKCRCNFLNTAWFVPI